jgi:hypothetical protein
MEMPIQVHSVKETIHVDPIEKRVNVDPLDDIVNFDLPHNSVDIDTFDDWRDNFASDETTDLLHHAVEI